MSSARIEDARLRAHQVLLKRVEDNREKKPWVANSWQHLADDYVLQGRIDDGETVQACLKQIEREENEPKKEV